MTPAKARRRTTSIGGTTDKIRFSDEVWERASAQAAAEGREAGGVIRDLLDSFGYIDPDTGDYEWQPPAGFDSLVEAFGGLEAAEIGSAQRKIYLSTAQLQRATRRAFIEVEPLILLDDGALAKAHGFHRNRFGIPDDPDRNERARACYLVAVRVLTDAYGKGLIGMTLRPSRVVPIAAKKTRRKSRAAEAAA